MKQRLLTILLTLMPLLASADDSGTCGDGLTYVYIEATHTLTISKTSDGTGVIESGNELLDSGGNQQFDDDGNVLFYTCWDPYRTEILTIIIEDGVTSIGDHAFFGCSGLISITIPNSVTSIGNFAFQNCNSLTSLPIPNSVISIGDYAFADCTSLTSLPIPNSVISIGDYAFARCTGLTSLTIPNGVTSIRSSTFSGCTSLALLTIPNSVISIGDYAFYGCTGLTSLIIPNSVTSIGNSTFSGCTSLALLTIPNSVISIGDYAFRECTGLVSLIIPNSVQTMGEWSFSGYKYLTSVTLPDCISSIGPNSFKNCSSLYSIKIPNGVTSIGNYAFYNCSCLTSLSIPEGVTSIGDYAFSLCSGLASLSIPDGVTSIGYFAFRDCSGLTSLSIPNSVTSIGDNAFDGCSSLTSLVIPDGVTSIGKYVFSGCSSLSSINIPNNVTSIGYGAFDGCRGLNSITIPNSVTTIGEYAFSSCSGLTSVTLPDNLKLIKKQSFYNCSKLTSITIPAAVEVIYQEAFARCSSLQQINALPTTPPFIYDKTFSNYSVPLKVPSGCEEVYKNAEHWKNFTNISDIPTATIEKNGIYYNLRSKNNSAEVISNPNRYSGEIIIPETVEFEGTTFCVTSIGDKAFNNCDDLISVIIPNSVTIIGDKVFAGCWALTSLIIPNSVTSMGEWKFSGYEQLTHISLPNCITTIHDKAFYGCSALASINIPNNVTSIGSDSFYKCSALITLNIPNNVTSIGKHAFVGCISLQQINVQPINPPTIYNDTFSDYSIPLIVPSGCVEAYKNADNWKNFTDISDGTKSYILTYIIDGEEFKTIDVLYGAEISPEPNPTKEGYTFSGWSEIPKTMPDHDVTVTGTFTINKYKLIYMVDGEEYKSFEIEYNSTITPEPDPTKDGYNFSGWSEIPETMPAHDVTITGSFERVYSGGDVANLINLLLFGNVDDEDITLYDMNGDGELNIGDLILIMRAAQNNSRNRSAANRAIAENQSLEFAADIVTMKPGETSALNISLSGSISDIYGIQFEVNLPEGFSLEEGANDKIYEMSANQVDDIICIDRDLGNGTYRFFIYSSTLQELKGGSLMSLNLKADADKALGNYDVNISNVALSDYDGHVTKEDGISVGVKVTDFFTLLYKVDGEDYKSYEIEYGASITPETEPTKEGCTFSGWSEIPETMPANDVMVTGTFIINKYKLTYIVDGEVYKSYELEYGTNITLEAEPTKEGYTFSGWRTIPVTMPANDVTITGTFTINKYTLTYMVDGEVYKTSEADYGTTITPEAAPTKTGYSFSGWDDVPLTMPANDVTVTGSFIINKYQITYIIDGEVFTTGYVEYGATIVPPTVEEKEGFTFSGWDDIPETMPAHDIVVHASYTSIIGVLMSSQQNVRIYSPNGKKLDKLQKGLNIVILDDGTVKKVVVK